MSYVKLRDLRAWEPMSLAPLGAGELVGVRVSLPIPELILQQVHVAERELAHQEAADARRWACFVGGRLALRAALRGASAPAQALSTPILRLTDGAPQLPSGIAGSISHKRGMVVAVALPHDDLRLGIDLECVEPVTQAFAARVLTCEELADVQCLPPEDFAAAVTEIFTVKEAVYKALPETQQFGLDFDGLRVEGAPFSPARRVRGSSARTVDEPLLKVDVRREGRWVLAVARYRRA